MLMGYNGLKVVTLTQLGYSSSAEIFFFISGYLLGYLNLGGRADYNFAKTSAKLVSRAAHLMCMNCALYVFILAVTAFVSPDGLDKLYLSSALMDVPNSAMSVLSMTYHLPLLGILNFYILFMLITVPAGFVIVRYPAIAAAGFVGLYAFSQLFPQYSIHGGHGGGNGYWAFNPFAWQIVFFGGLFAGRYRLHEAMEKHATAILIGSAAIYLAMFGVFMVEKVFHWFTVPMVDKQQLPPIRLLHAAVTISLMLSALYKFKFLMNNAISTVLQTIGRYSLECFMVSVCLSYVMAIVWAHYDGTKFYFIIAAAGVAALPAFAYSLSTVRRAARA